MIYSYERVSTTKQDERRQEISLEQFKIEKRYIDKVTGKHADRPQLNKLKIDCRNNDHIYCESISRLGRNVDDLRGLVEYFISKGTIVHFVKEGFDTSGHMYKFLLTILGAVAEMEREMIVDRVREGVEKAKRFGTKTGKPFGRPQAEQPKDFDKYYKKWQAKEITAVEFAKLLKVSRATLYRYIAQESGEPVEARKPLDEPKPITIEIKPIKTVDDAMKRVEQVKQKNPEKQIKTFFKS
jgi:DNA invertase Pin-like site-specific DNA recombinase